MTDKKKDTIKVREHERRRSTTKADPAKLNAMTQPPTVGTKIITRDPASVPQRPNQPTKGVTIIGGGGSNGR